MKFTYKVEGFSDSIPTVSFIKSPMQQEC